ncbi:MAG: MoxR family ATPase [Blautia sp.]|nr:MoxR family ATPase [Lachnoclostridium sp.]MCM1211617.1 MoxR family ATPase [Blautia sp.]
MARKIDLIMKEIGKAVIGKDECIRKVMMAALAQGHILIEDIPGVGKTTLALAVARAMGLAQNRVQFTPDLLPSDITGFSSYDRESGSFQYHEGAVMCNVLLADEINRTSAKTQSALLEVMEEYAVTVDGVNRPVPQPFFVIATENPVGATGTQMLPESQLDRFLICIVMGYLEKEDEKSILRDWEREGILESIEAVATKQELMRMQEKVKSVFIHDRIMDYIIELSDATRNHEQIQLGLSTRGSIAVARMARAAAYLGGRDFVIPEDVREIFPDVARHRLKMAHQSRMGQVSAGQVIEEILHQVRMPRPEDKYEK